MHTHRSTAAFESAFRAAASIAFISALAACGYKGPLYPAPPPPPDASLTAPPTTTTPAKTGEADAPDSATPSAIPTPMQKH